MYIYRVIDLKVLVRSFNCESRACYVGNPRECFFHFVSRKLDTSSTAQGGGGSFKHRKHIGEVGCCESGMAERIHWWTERCLISLTLSPSFSDYLPTYLPIFYVSSLYLSIYLSIYLSLSFILLPIYLSIYISISFFHLSICLPVYLWCSVTQSNAV